MIMESRERNIPVFWPQSKLKILCAYHTLKSAIMIILSRVILLQMEGNIGEKEANPLMGEIPFQCLPNCGFVELELRLKTVFLTKFSFKQLSIPFFSWSSSSPTQPQSDTLQRSPNLTIISLQHKHGLLKIEIEFIKSL